jgi:hypothetical protein
MTCDHLDRELLIGLFNEREQLDPLTAAYAYLSGRIDEYCSQNAIEDDDREQARIAGSRG